MNYESLCPSCKPITFRPPWGYSRPAHGLMEACPGTALGFAASRTDGIYHLKPPHREEGAEASPLQERDAVALCKALTWDIEEWLWGMQVQIRGAAT